MSQYTTPPNVSSTSDDIDPEVLAWFAEKQKAEMLARIAERNAPVANPAYSNTQDMDTSGEKPVGLPPVSSSLVDYVAFTYKGEGALAAALAFLGGEDKFVPAPGNRHYRQCLKNHHIRVYFEGVGNCKGSVYCVAAGKGCAQISNKQGFSWAQWFALLLLQPCKMRRLDLCCDDHDGILNLDTIRNAAITRSLVSTYAKAGNMWELSLAKEEGDDGETITFGKRTGDSMVRFYNKGKQLGGSESYVRCELELHKDQARIAAQRIAGGAEVGALLAGAIQRKLDFKTKVEGSKDTNKARWPRADWWDKFLGVCEQVKLGTHKVACTVQARLAWLARAVAPAIAVLDACMPDPFWLEGLVQDARERLGDKLYKLASSLADSSEAPALYQEEISKRERASADRARARKEQEEARQVDILGKFFGDIECPYDLYHGRGPLLAEEQQPYWAG